MEASQTENGQIPVIFVHGAWLSARSWEKYVDYFGKRGSAVSAPEWPRKQGDVEELRETAEASAGLGVQEIVEHYERLIRDLDQPPVLIGHSYGGLFVELLVDRGGRCRDRQLARWRPRRAGRRHATGHITSTLMAHEVELTLGDGRNLWAALVAEVDPSSSNTVRTWSS